MPLPFILAGAAMAAAGYGIKKGLDAKEDYEKAEHYNKRAQEIYDEAQEELEEAREETQKALEDLGKVKLKLYEIAIIPFIENYKKINNIEKKVKLSYQIEKIGKFNKNLSLEDIEFQLKELVGGGIASLGAGGLVGLATYGGVGALATASTGTAIGTLSGAAATNATLAWLGGGSLAAGGFGMAGGMAVLGGIVAGPVLAVGGMMMASKAEEAKENAYSNYKQAKIAAEEMKTAASKTRAIKRRVVELQNLTVRIYNNYFRDYLDELEELVNRKTNWNRYTYNEQLLVVQTGLFAKTLFNLLEVNIIDEKGKLTKESEKRIKKIDLDKLGDEVKAEAVRMLQKTRG